MPKKIFFLFFFTCTGACNYEILHALRKIHMHQCMCACAKSSTATVSRVFFRLDSQSSFCRISVRCASLRIQQITCDPTLRASDGLVSDSGCLLALYLLPVLCVRSIYTQWRIIITNHDSDQRFNAIVSMGSQEYRCSVVMMVTLTNCA